MTDVTGNALQSDARPTQVDLSSVPIRQRRLLTFLLAPMGLVLLVAGVLAVVLSASVVGHVVGVIVALVALLTLGVAQGLHRSVRLDEHRADEARLDAAIMATAGSSCGDSCDACGVDDCAVKSLPRS